MTFASVVLKNWAKVSSQLFVYIFLFTFFVYIFLFAFFVYILFVYKFQGGVNSIKTEKPDEEDENATEEQPVPGST